MDVGTLLSVVSFVFGNPLVLAGVVGVFVGWNLPQPALAKKVQDKVVAALKYLWGLFNDNVVQKLRNLRK